MDRHLPGRRDFLMTMTALGAASLPAFRSRAVSAAGATWNAAGAAYDPVAKFEITVREV